MNEIREIKAFRLNGFVMLAIVLALLALAVWLLVQGILRQQVGVIVSGSLLLVFNGIFLMPGFFTVQPNQSRVLVFLGRYIGSVRQDGFKWGNPFAIKRKVSLRVRNFSSEKIKVNDSVGNPIEIGTVVVWRVVDSAKALFDVDHYVEFVDIQSETAIRALATRYSYDPAEEGGTSLRGSPDSISEEMTREVQDRLQVAGVEVIETRLTHLAYAPEIAQAMLRRQQARAVIQARRLIVDAAVGMVEQALKHLSENKIVHLDEERKAAMVNNLMVVLTSEHSAAPVLNTGTLYT